MLRGGAEQRHPLERAREGGIQGGIPPQICGEGEDRVPHLRRLMLKEIGNSLPNNQRQRRAF